MRNHTKYMQLALELAKKGEGNTSPNPMVGCVIVKNNRIIGQGYHRKCGTAHAEINALRQAGKKAKTAVMYVTLEPCATHGCTGPCTDKIIESKIKKVFISMIDPNPINKGKGVKQLKKTGITLDIGLGAPEATYLNRAFIKKITKKLPFVTVKVAQSLDGKIATKTGESQWISGKKSRLFVKKLRATQDAIMVGANTVIKDNPRLFGKKNLIRIIVDEKFSAPVSSRVFSKTQPTILATTNKSSKTKIKKIKSKGVEVIYFKTLKNLFQKLAQKKIMNLLIEGGGSLIAASFKEKLVDQVFVFIAPKIIGGKEAITAVEGNGISNINQSLKLKNMQFELSGDDILIKAEV